jgi:hypothetical protein
LGFCLLAEAVVHFKKGDFIGSLLQLPDWNRGFEVPDVIGFADLLDAKHDVARDLSSQGGVNEPGRLNLFPYPNPGRPPRLIAVAMPLDTVMLRTAAGRILQVTDPQLPNAVLSYRMRRPPPHWLFRRGGYRTMCERAMDLMNLGAASAGCKTDIAAYYLSIERGKLFATLLERGCHETDVLVLMSAYSTWSERTGLQGIPIGPEASAVVGNFYLIHVDEALATSGLIHLRYMDDFVILSRQADDGLEVLDRELSRLQLRRSIEKTTLFNGSGEASACLTDTTLDYVQDALSEERPAATDELRRLFDDIVTDATPSRSRFRYVLGRLRRRGDPWSIDALVADPRLMRLDPQLGADYLGAFVVRNQRLRDDLMSRLLSPIDVPEEEAVRLHLLRVASRMAWGGPEGAVFESVALDGNRPAPLRGWAWLCLARSPRWRSNRAMEAATELRNPYLRRAVVATLRRSPDGVTRRRFLATVQADRDLRYTARWVQAA